MHCYYRFYAPEDRSELSHSHRYISPGTKLSDDTLSKFPKTTLIIGQMDPLRDDSIHLLDRLLENGVDAQGLEFRHMHHGFVEASDKSKKDLCFTLGADYTTKILKDFIEK